jgi:hypothetical protein
MKFKIVFMLFMLGFVIVGIGRINIINTKALSPLANTNENYEKIKEELGEEFSDFIKDNAQIKIYNQPPGDILVRAWDKDFTIRIDSDIKSATSNISDKIGGFFSEIKNKIDSIILG